jgi:imidazoleglycerol-phosphate dehydratase
MRAATVSRRTNETEIFVSVALDGTGDANVKTGVGFFDHMLEQLAHHSLIDLNVKATGDLHIDQHHTVEDVGIAIGQALNEALADRKGIVRYADCAAPMDETLTRAAIDLSGRPFLVFLVDFPTSKIGDFDTELVREFFQALAVGARMALHVQTVYGTNSHHIAESCFKAVARCLRGAVSIDSRRSQHVPSTKGSI